MKNKAIIITGPTATGKTSLATNTCRQFNGQIISADSRQVYRGLDIGTGKDLDDYQGETPVEYHMIDICDPTDEFSLFDWRQNYIDIYSGLKSKNVLPVICGGTPLYLDMLLNDYELKGNKREYSNKDLEGKSLEDLVLELQKNSPDLAAKTDLTQKARVLRALEISQSSEKQLDPLPECEYLILAPYWHRKVVHARIEKRLNERWQGLIAETQALLDQGVSHTRLDWFGLEYRFMSRFFLKELTEKEAFDQLLIKIRQFAKRQDIWFRKMEKNGHVIHWLGADDKLDEAASLIKLFLAGAELPKPELKISEITYGPRTQ